jgi:hypothetical protein
MSVDPTLAVGEMGFETDTGRLKVGTGSTAWSSLLYVTDASDLAGIIPSARISGSYAGITGVGTVTAGDIASTLLSGTIASARISGSYTGITGVGIIGAGTWNAGVIAGLYGGTGVANSGKTITLGGNLTTSGLFATTLTVTGTTSVTLPTSGTLATSDAASLTSGFLATARLSGSYTGITGVGTLPNLTIGGAGANRSITINAPTGYYAIQYFQINGVYKWHYEVNPAGDRWSLVESGVAERIGVTSTGATFSGTVTATTFSGALSGNATSATTATTATTAGSSSVTTFTSSRFQGTYSTLSSSHYDQALRGGNGGAAAGMALWVSGIACQFRLGTGEDKVYLMNAENTAPSTFRAIIDAVSSVHFKQDIKTFPMLVNAAGSAVNEAEIESGLNIVRQLRPVTYKWKEKLHLSQLPSNPRRALALSRLNKIRSSKGLDPYESDELQHDCSRDDCNGNAEDPCSRVKNWENGNIGFIAQEVGAIIPQAANLDKDGEYSGLDNLALTAIAVASIKELDLIVESLKERIKQLEESNINN